MLQILQRTSALHNTKVALAYIGAALANTEAALPFAGSVWQIQEELWLIQNKHQLFWSSSNLYCSSSDFSGAGLANTETTLSATKQQWLTKLSFLNPGIIHGLNWCLYTAGLQRFDLNQEFCDA